MAATRITRTTVDNVTWTPIVAPAECDFVAFYAEGATVLLIRSDSADPATEKQLAANIQETVASSPMRARRISRFFQGETVYYVKKATAGTEVVVATWAGLAE
jgi:hypothetical protein